ncbi:flagellar protein FliT [Nitrosococcus wardiae]|uniref:Flagellar protein FliT n=1 Tax=Nitrosococcus wardiae TaxID=1814290 RepID=A0A4P7BZ39_9GAMM|nr:flagellar protein FliT [Nitrosococcus wardiae]QBQ54617.1 flagellar protein FliT [Nitrosococcus wardiae]
MGETLDILLALSQKMLLKAQEGAWQELADLQVERDKVLQQLFPPGNPLVSFPFARQRLEQLFSLNEQIVALCQQERDCFAQGLRKLQQGSQACDTYRSYTL